MNNAKLWLVVPPAVGVPVFLGAVAVGSFAVHVAVVQNTSWIADFLDGMPLDGSEETASVFVPEADTDAARVGYTLPLEGGGQEITVIMPDGTTARAILQPNEVRASASAPPILTQTH